jgi:hypothetical protein
MGNGLLAILVLIVILLVAWFIVQDHDRGDSGIDVNVNVPGNSGGGSGGGGTAGGGSGGGGGGGGSAAPSTGGGGGR